MWNFAMNVASIGCCAAKGSDRAVHKIINVLYTYKDSLDDLKEAEEILKSEGTSADADLIQVAKTLRERVAKLLLDVLEVHKLQECLGVAQSAPRAPIFSSNLCEYPEVSFSGVGGEAKRRRALLSKTGAKTKISVGGPKDGVVVHVDVKGKGRVLSEGKVVEGVEMNPLIWSNLPVNLVELVLALVVPQIKDSSQCRSIRLPDSLPPSEVSKLMYTKSGIGLLALGSNALHKLWKWQRSKRNPSGKATASFSPQLWQPASGITMRNDMSHTCSEGAMPCIALSKNDSYVMSGSGGKVSLFNMMTFKIMTTFMPSPPAATVLAFHPQDNNIIAVGLEDSTIQIYNVRVDEVKTKLKGHQRRITGLAFSNTLNVLVSSGADAQISVWCTSAWRRRNVAVVQPEGRLPYMDETLVQFHKDQVKLLVVRESQLAIYNADMLTCLCQWVPQRSLLPQRSSTSLLTNATYSCDSQLVFAGFLDGCVVVFDAKNLEPCCWLAPSVYIPQGVPRSTVYPLVIAAHPKEPNQFALGLSDGGVQVIEPLEEGGKWGNGPSAEKGNDTDDDAYTFLSITVVGAAVSITFQILLVLWMTLFTASDNPPQTIWSWKVGKKTLVTYTLISYDA